VSIENNTSKTSGSTYDSGQDPSSHPLLTRLYATVSLTAAVTVTATPLQHLFIAAAETTPAELTLARRVVLGLHWYLTPA